MFVQKLGLKLWSTNDSYINAIEDCHKNGVFDYLELCVVPGSEKEYLGKWRLVKPPFVLHAPHSLMGLNLSLEGMESNNRGLIKEVDLFRRALNPRKIIFHPGVNGCLKETVRQVNIFKKEFPDVFKLVVIENKPRMGINGETCLGASPEEIQGVLEETGCGFCLDMGHAVCYANWQKVSYESVISRFLRLDPAMFHLCDGDKDSIKDMHLNLGQGNFNLRQIISVIPESTHVTLETHKRSPSQLDDFKEDVCYFRQCAQKN